MAGGCPRWGTLAIASALLLLVGGATLTVAPVDGGVIRAAAAVRPSASITVLRGALALEAFRPRVEVAGVAAASGAREWGVDLAMNINCGGPAIPDYLADVNFTDVSASLARAFQPPEGLEFDSVWHTLRYSRGTDRVLFYEVPLLANRTFSVDLGFSEVFYEEVGKRIMHVEFWAEDTLLYRSELFDVLAETGAMFYAYVFGTTVRLPASVLSIRIIGDVGNPAISVMRIVDVSNDYGNDADDDDDDTGGNDRPLLGHSFKGHSWNDGWFLAVTAGGLYMGDSPLEGGGSDDGVQSKTFVLPSNAERIPDALPADLYAAMNWTAKVKAASLLAPAGEALEFIIHVPVAGVYEVIFGWYDLTGAEPGMTVMDIDIGVDSETQTPIRGLDVAAIAVNSDGVVVAHLPPHSPLGATNNMFVEETLRVSIRPVATGRAFVNVIVVRQTPVLGASGEAIWWPSGGLGEPMPNGGPMPPMWSGGPMPPKWSGEPMPGGEPTQGDESMPGGGPMPSRRPQMPSGGPMLSGTPGAEPTPMETSAPTLPRAIVINMGGLSTENVIDVDAAVQTIADDLYFSPGTPLGTRFRVSDAAFASYFSNDPVLASVRYGKKLVYTVAVVPGIYTIEVVAVELALGPGKRTFDVGVSIDGGMMLPLASSYDLAATVGKFKPATWMVQAVNVEASFTVTLTATLENACVSAIRMYPMQMTGSPL